MDRHNTEKLLSAVWGKRDGYTFITYKQNGHWVEPKAISLARGHFDLSSVQMPGNADLYWCPVVFSSPRRKKENALPTNILWADLDPVNPNDCKVKPSIAWESSPGRYQALWFLDRDVAPEEAAELSKRIAYGDGGDKGGWDLTQVLRIPGTQNFKYPTQPEVKLMWANRHNYTPAEIEHSYPRVNGADTKLSPNESTLTWKVMSEAAIGTAVASLPIGTRKRLFASTEGADRSLELQKLSRDLLKYGLSPELVLHLIQRSTWNKFAGRSDEHSQLLKQVSSALTVVRSRQLANQQQTELITESPADVPAIILPQMQIKQWTEFLTIPTHLQWLVEDTWVDRTVGFISGRSKSYKTWIALDLGLSVLSGQPFLGLYRVARTGPVLLIQEEDPAAILQERLRLIAKSKGMLPTISFSPEPTRFTIDYPEYPLHIINLQSFQLTDEDKLNEVREAIARIKPVAVIVDPFINVLGEVNEHQATEMVRVLQLMKMWREEFGCNVVVVHHWNKTKSEEGDRGGDHMYGSFALHAWLESALHVNPIIDPEGERIDTVVVEREFKAAPGSRALKLKFEIDTVKEFTYHVSEESALEASKALQTVLDVLVTHGDWMITSDLVASTGYRRERIVELAGRLRRMGKVEYRAGGGRGKPSGYRARSE